MARLPMNFAAQSPWSRLTLCFLLIGVSGSLYELGHREALLTQMESQQALSRRLERSVNRAQMLTAAVTKQDPKAAVQIQKLVEELQRPWEAMLDSLQRAAGKDMLITRLQPESGKAGLTRLLVSGQADSSEAFLAYVQRLKKEGHWSAVLPVNEEYSGGATAAPGDKPLTFQLLAEWQER